MQNIINLASTPNLKVYKKCNFVRQFSIKLLTINTQGKNHIITFCLVIFWSFVAIIVLPVSFVSTSVNGKPKSNTKKIG